MSRVGDLALQQRVTDVIVLIMSVGLVSSLPEHLCSTHEDDISRYKCASYRLFKGAMCRELFTQEVIQVYDVIIHKSRHCYGSHVSLKWRQLASFHTIRLLLQLAWL